MSELNSCVSEKEHVQGCLLCTGPDVHGGGGFTGTKKVCTDVDDRPHDFTALSAPDMSAEVQPLKSLNLSDMLGVGLCRPNLTSPASENSS